jgi:O-antigen/teichoic acid export membrane protein
MTATIETKTRRGGVGAGSNVLSPTLPVHRVASWGVVGSVTYAACQWGMLIALAKLGTSEMLGQFALGFAVAAPVFLLTNLSLRDVLATDARSDHAVGDYVTLRILGTLLAFVAIVLVAGTVRYRTETKAVILLVGIVKAIEALSDVLYGLMQKHERMDLIARSVVMRGGLSVIALAGAVYVTRSILWALVLVAAVWAFTLVAHDIPRARRALPGDLRPRWVPADLSRLLGISLPLWITVMLISLSTTIPRYVLERSHGEHELGAFAALAYLMVIGSTVVNALGQSVSSRLARYYATGDELAARRLLIRLIGLGLVLGGAGVMAALVAGEEILTLLYRPEYARHRSAFVVLMAATGIGYVTSFLYYAVTSARVFRPQLLLFVGVAGVTVAASLVLITRAGVFGAAEATVVTSMAALLGTAGIYIYALRLRNRRAITQYSPRSRAAAEL